MNFNRMIKRGLVTAVIASSILSPISCASVAAYCYFKHRPQQNIHLNRGELEKRPTTINYKEKMPSLEHLIVMGYTEGHCFSLLNPNIVTKRYSRGDEMSALSVSRINANNPYAVIDEDGILYLDNGVKGGVPEDGYVDHKLFILSKPNRGVCDDYPHIREI